MALYWILIGQLCHSVDIFLYSQLSMAVLYISPLFRVTEMDALVSHNGLALSCLIQTQLVQSCDSISDCGENNGQMFSMFEVDNFIFSVETVRYYTGHNYLFI